MEFDLDDFNAMLAAGMFDDGMEGARGRGDGGRGNFAPWRGLNNALDGAHGNGGAEVGAIRAARRARREREAREKAERANRPPEVTHVDLVGATTTTTASKKKNLPPGGGGNGGAAAGGVIAIDLTDGVSPTPCGGDGGPTGRSSGVGRRVRARMEVAAENGGSQTTVDLT
ncbi:uncharacterized protein MICPUCDRAFT_59867 [Micromonas pusilla CCMP1545]|uniref:Predicted protein n=1 Tax=Micromonas pusilla (strain CCMP1545) TaxID=564608 RepID=C1MYD0_MICPC|nr:uncharacterized protein MICPUCDRAFT_59867 [Micromonas pusilla CCMP1545]EEH55032.1 predicted protein [Micromonas pusilla CCMP1545]|eukprot:XP_003060263.1 predicted protein [Micromonas pusilla CCMP1545]